MVNHSASPNLRLVCDPPPPALPRKCFLVATRDIAPLSELIWDYGPHRERGWEGTDRAAIPAGEAAAPAAGPVVASIPAVGPSAAARMLAGGSSATPRIPGGGPSAVAAAMAMEEKEAAARAAAAAWAAAKGTGETEVAATAAAVAAAAVAVAAVRAAMRAAATLPATATNAAAMAPASAAATSATAAAAPATFSADAPPAPVSELEGYTLMLSKNSSTGYLFVYTSGNWFMLALTSYLDGVKTQSRVLGFATAVKAALWYAKFLAGENPLMPRGGQFRPHGELTTSPRLAETPAAPAAAGAVIQEGGGAHAADDTTAVPTPVRPS